MMPLLLRALPIVALVLFAAPARATVSVDLRLKQPALVAPAWYGLHLLDAGAGGDGPESGLLGAGVRVAVIGAVIGVTGVAIALGGSIVAGNDSGVGAAISAGVLIGVLGLIGTVVGGSLIVASFIVARIRYAEIDTPRTVPAATPVAVTLRF